MKEEAHPKRQ